MITAAAFAAKVFVLEGDVNRHSSRTRGNA
jgi:hypothetical protein